MVPLYRTCMIQLLIGFVAVNSASAQVETTESVTPKSMRLTGPIQFQGDRVFHASPSGSKIRSRNCCQLIDTQGGKYSYAIRTHVEEVSDGDDTKKITHYHFEYQGVSIDGRPSTIEIGYWNSEDDDPIKWKPLGTQLSESGVPYAVVKKIDKTGVFTKRSLMLLRGGVQHTVLATGRIAELSEVRLLLGKDDKPLIFGRLGQSLVTLKGTKPETLIENANYDWSVARDAEGWLYLLAYDFGNRAFYVTFSNEDSSEWTLRMIDSAEAGWQHSLSMLGNKLVVAYYYYRNAFNKGLSVATIEKGEIVNRIFERERNGNLGWKPKLYIDPAGKVELGYLGDVRKEIPASHTFNTVEEMFSRPQPEYLGEWEDHYRNWLIVAGADTAFQWWHVWAPGPWNSGAIDADYDYKPGLLLTAFSEARIGSMNLGLSYTANLLGDVIETNAGTGARRAYEVLSGFVGWNDLVWGHDVRIGVSRAQLKGVYTDDNDPGVFRSLDSELYEFDFGLLNQMRIRYGATFKYYNLAQPVYVYQAPSGSKEYSFYGSRTVESSVYRAALYVNYSMLDYLSKYETEYVGLDVEGTLAAGIGISLWDEENVNGHDTGGTFQPAGRLGIKVSYLMYKRFYAMHGAGLFLKAGYRFQADAHGFMAGTPGDRDDDDVSGSDFDVRAVHYQFEQGPFLNFGLVY